MPDLSSIGTNFGHLVVFLLLSSAGLLIVYSASREWSILFRLKTGGRLSQATIFDAWPEYGGRNVAYFVTVSYEVGGKHQRMKFTQQIGRKHFPNLQRGQPVSVRYLPTHSHIVRLAGQDVDTTRIFWETLLALIAITLLYPLIIWAILIFAFYQYKYR